MEKQMMFQRRMLGILCMSLVPACILFGLLGDNLPYWYCSISATYYANSKICMIGLLFATSVFFLSYRCYDRKDVVMSIVQAVACLGVIVFPCITDGVEGKVGLFGLEAAMSNYFHIVSALILFVAFGTNIFFLFTLGDTGNPQKAKRNIVYRVCGLLIYGFTLFEVLRYFIPVPKWFPLTLINETVILESFAVAWLVKSGLFIKDNKFVVL